MAHPPTIALNGITKRFPGVTALDNVSLAFHPGQIHAVIGENGAGKSTMMNIIAGNYQPDRGQIVFQSQPVEIPSPVISQRMGIRVVYQELLLCPNLSVAENISLDTAAGGSGLRPFKRRTFAEKARGVLGRLGLAGMDVGQPVGALTIAQQQMVEIAKAISSEARVLILDEPNSALTYTETLHLFTALEQLKAEGVAIIYVSHRLEEVLQIADVVSVMRDGKYIDTTPKHETSINDMITKMVGRAMTQLYQRPTAANPVTDHVLLEVSGLSSPPALRGVSFAVHAGEIVGVAGLPDAGKDELVDCLFGLRPYEGRISIDGQVARLDSPAQAIDKRLLLVPADRRESGALLVMDVQQNIAAANLKHLSRAGFLDRPAMTSLAHRYIEQLRIKVSGLGQRMATLSGGNQQKAILARGLATDPQVLILHEPTRGIDVGAKAEIYQILQGLAQQGVGVLLISSELPELMGQCDRIVVLHQGTQTGTYTRSEFSEEAIMAAATGQVIIG